MAVQIKRDRITSTQLEADRLEIERLRSFSEEYGRYKERWDFYLQAYEGGDDFASKDNLFRHPRESQKDFDARAERIHCINYCDQLTDFFTDFIYAETIQRDGGKDAGLFNEFKQDVNKKGDDIDAFMRQVSTEYRVFGMLWGIVDAPTVDAQLSRKQEKDLGIRPYWVIARPQEMLDWVADSFDTILYVKRKQIVYEFDYATKRKRVLERYTEWTLDEITVTDIDITDGESKAILRSPKTITNKINEVPVVVFRFKRSLADRFMGVSFLVNFAKNNREIMNLTSLLQEFLYRQCYNILTMQIDPNVAVQQQQQGDPGTSNALLYPRDAERPEYIAPNVATAEFLQKERETLIKDMFKRAAQDMVNELYNGNKASGYSKSMSFSTTAPRIASSADTLERGENRMMELTYKFRKAKWNGKIKYKDHYEITNLTDEFDALKRLFMDMQCKSETMMKESMKRMVQRIDSKKTPDIQAKIDAEIDKMDMKDWFETQKLALIKSPAKEPAASASATQPNPKEAAAKSAARTPKRAPSTKSEVASESSKKPKPGGRKAKAVSA